MRVLEDRTYGRIEILAFQEREIGKAEGRQLRSRNCSDEIRLMKADLLNSRMDVSSFFVRSAESRARLVDWDFQQLRASLLREQQDEWDRHVARWTVSVRGLPWSLVRGSLGRQIEVTPAQAERIRDAARRSGESIDRDLTRMEIKVWKTFRILLADHIDAKEIDKIVPGNLDGLSPVPSLLVR